jgi:DNA repair protein RadA/Sms
MAKERVRYVCSNCGEVSLSWAGKCPHCGAWNTLQEERVMESSPGRVATSGRKLEVATVGSVG